MCAPLSLVRALTGQCNARASRACEHHSRMYVRVRWRVQAENLTRAFVHRLLCAGLLRSRSPGPLGRATVVEEQLLLYSSLVPREGVPVLGCFNGDLPARHDARRLPKVRAHSASTHRTRLPTHTAGSALALSGTLPPLQVQVPQELFGACLFRVDSSRAGGGLLPTLSP